jgi:hypothetical protein
VSSDVKKRHMEEPYARGIAKARETGALEGLLDSMASLVVPDSMGVEEYQSYRKGYSDYMTGKIADKSPSPKKLEIPLGALEKAWYGLCNNSEFISREVVRRYSELLKASGNTVAIVVGLRDFADSRCPTCAADGQYKIHFLGRLKHPECGTEWYMGPGSYMGFQLASVFHTGIRAGGGMKEDSDRKGERGGWIGGIVGFMMAAVFRLALAVVLIPIQAVVSLSQGKPKSANESSF